MNRRIKINIHQILEKTKGLVSMKVFKAAVIKLISVGLFTFSVYGIFQFATISRLALITLIIAGITFLGDLFILPKINQAQAAIADFIVLFVLYLFLGNLVIGGTTNLIIPAFAATFFVGLSELFFHLYVMDRIHGERRYEPPVGDVQFEVAEEIKPTEKKEDLNEK